MADLQGSLPIDPNGPDETLPDEIDMRLVQECMGGDVAFIEQLQESLRPLYVWICTTHMDYLTDFLYSTRFRRDEQTWRHRLVDFHRSWVPLIGGMADAYLRWKYPDDLHPNSPSVNLQVPPSPQQPSSPANDLAAVSLPGTNHHPPAPNLTNDSVTADAPSPSISNLVEITAIDIYTLSTSVKFSCEGDQTTASTLAGLGFIGNAPFHPSVAVSIKTLELYRILRRRKPSFSVEGFVKVISDLYMVSTPFVVYSAVLNPSRSHIAPNTVASFLMLSTHTWKSSGSLMNVLRLHSVTIVPTGVC